MAVASGTDLVEILRQGPFLQPAQRDELKHARPGPANAQTLVQELVRRGWLTLFQARFLLDGRAQELVLGPYVVLDQLGTGGAGQVYKAWHQKMKRVVAVKVLKPNVAKDRDAVGRFYREIELSRQLSHPHIVSAYEAGPVGDVLVLALEYVEGTTLEQLVQKSGPLPVSRACEYIRQTAVGLQYAHERGLIHRDIKPSNLLLARPTVAGGAEVVKILDLGLARLEHATGSVTADLTVADGQSVMQGTPDYMAPEQALDFHRADIRADIYSLGCTLYFLLTGRPPFSGKSLAEKLMKHQTAAPTMDGIRPAPLAVTGLLLKMLAKDPAQRPQTPGEIALALRPFCPVPATAVSLGGSTDTMSVAAVNPTPVPGASATYATAGTPSRRARRRWLVPAGVAGVMVAALAVFAIVGQSSPSAARMTTRSQPETSNAPSEPRSVKIVSHRGRFQGPTPAPGWQYLWNAKGAIGKPAHYQPLLWFGGHYNSDGKGALPRPDPGCYLHLGRDGGHPGRGAQQSQSIDYYAIAAYTIQPADGPGYYRIGQSMLRRGNGLEVLVHVGSRSPLFSAKVAKDSNPAAAFDANIGLLTPGDTVYVAIGPDGSDDNDSFELDFTISRESGPTLPLGYKAALLSDGFENPAVCWDQRGPAEFSVSTTQPHQGTRVYQIIVPSGESLNYQQISRTVEENPQVGDIYQLAAWVRTQDLKDGVGAYGCIEFVGDKGNRIALQHTKVHITNGAKGWERLTAQAAVLPGTVRVRVALILQAHGTAWFDDVEVTRETRAAGQ